MNDYNLLKQLYEIHSPSGKEESMSNFLTKESIRRGARVEVDETGNLYITKGESETYPCICAHMDQVQKNHSKDFTVMRRNGIIFAYSPSRKQQQGLGADDKNGLWIALELLQKLDVLKCAFFVGEEIGCVGSSHAYMDFFKDVRYCIEPDRRNGDDLITEIGGRICSKEFLKAINYRDFGYKPTTGMMTDVETLCENGIGVSCINISCGYYNPHTDQECTSWMELCNARDFALHICETLTDVYPHEYTNGWSYHDSWYGRRTFSSIKDYDDVWDYDSDFDTMNNILSYEPHLTFEEVMKYYERNFLSDDIDILRGIYEDVMPLVEDEYLNDDEDETPLEKKK